MDKNDSTSTAEIKRRLLAYVLDWAIGGIITGFPAVLLYGIVTKRSDMFSDLYVFESLGYNSAYGFFAGFLCLLMAIIYYILVPFKEYPGQTIGKKIAKVQIRTWTDNDPGLKCLLLRYGVIFMFETPLFIISSYLMQMLTLATRFYIESVWSYVGLAASIISVIMVIYSKKHDALHDLIAKTKVIDISE